MPRPLAPELCSSDWIWSLRIGIDTLVSIKHCVREVTMDLSFFYSWNPFKIRIFDSKGIKVKKKKPTKQVSNNDNTVTIPV